MNEATPSKTGRGKNKHFWSLDKDKVLVTSLSELVIDPDRRSKNGFRNDYMFRMEEMIRKAIPNCGFKATPHIDSRIKTLLSSLENLLKCLVQLDSSGMMKGISFIWSDRCMMSIAREQLRSKFCLVSVMRKRVMLVAIKLRWENLPLNQREQKGRKPPTARDARKVMVSFMKDMNLHLSTMTSAMSDANAREKEAADQKKKMLQELLALEGITPDQAYDVAEILTSKLHKLNLRVLMKRSPFLPKWFFVGRKIEMLKDMSYDPKQFMLYFFLE